jgi:hypothetical protein
MRRAELWKDVITCLGIEPVLVPYEIAKRTGRKKPGKKPSSHVWSVLKSLELDRMVIAVSTERWENTRTRSSSTIHHFTSKYALSLKGLICYLSGLTHGSDVAKVIETYKQTAKQPPLGYPILQLATISAFPFFDKSEELESMIGPSVYAAFIEAAKATWDNPPLPPFLDREPAFDKMKTRDLETEIVRDQISPFWPKMHILGATKYTPREVFTRDDEIKREREELEWRKKILEITSKKSEEYLKKRSAPDRLWRDAFGLNFIKFCPWPSREKMQKIINDPEISHFVRDLLRNTESKLEITRKAIEGEEKALQELRATVLGRALRSKTA